MKNTILRSGVILLYWNIFGIVLSNRSHPLDYNELRELGVSCPLQDSCRRKSPFGQNTEMSCECDPLCPRRGTCCIDAIFLHPSRKPNEKCVDADFPSNRFVYMVTQCDPNWSGDPHVRSECENPSFNDPLSRIPVTVSTSQITYTNYFCAQCNNNRGEMTFWNLYIYAYFRPGEIEKIDKDKFAENIEPGENGGWYYRLKNSTHEDRLIYMDFSKYPPDNIKHLLKDCAMNYNLKSTCPETWSDNVVKEKCEAYMALVNINGKEYRNAHCATCNNISIKDPSCISLASRLPPERPFGGGPIAEIFDISLSEGNRVGKVRCCQAGEVLDPFNGQKSARRGSCEGAKCRAILCRRRGYVLKDFRCVRST